MALIWALYRDHLEKCYSHISLCVVCAHVYFLILLSTLQKIHKELMGLEKDRV